MKSATQQAIIRVNVAGQKIVFIKNIKKAAILLAAFV